MLDRVLVQRAKRFIRRNLIPESTSRQQAKDLPADVLPDLSLSDIANTLLSVYRDGGGKGALTKTFKRYDIVMRDKKHIANHSTSFFESPENALESFEALWSAFEHRPALTLLHASAIKFSSEKAIWEKLASTLAAHGQTVDAAIVYGFMADNYPHKTYNAWNAATLFLSAGRLDEGLSYWSKIPIDFLSEPRAAAFAPIISTLNAENGKEIKSAWQSTDLSSEDLPDWVTRRVKSVFHRCIPQAVVSKSSLADRMDVESLILESSFGEEWDKGWAFVDPKHVSDTPSILRIMCEAARLGQREKAIEIVNQFAEDAEETPSDWINVAKGYTALGLFDDALKAINKLDAGPADLEDLVYSIPEERTDNRVMPLVVEVLGRAPNHLNIAKRVGEIAYQAGRIDVAVDAYARVWEKESGNAALAERIGSLCLMQGDTDKALIALNNALEIAPDLQQARKLRSHVHFQNSDFLNAIDDLNIALESSDEQDDRADLLYFQSVAYRSARQHEQAAKAAKNLLDCAIDPHKYVDKAAILFLTESALSGSEDQLNDAVDFVKVELETKETSFSRTLMYLVYLFNLKLYDDARIACERLLSLAPDGLISRFWAAYLGYVIDDAELINLANTISSDNLDSRLGILIKAAYLTANQQPEDAIELLAPIISSDPNFGRAGYFLASAMIEKGNAQGALPYLKRLVEGGDFGTHVKALIKTAKTAGAKAKGIKLTPKPNDKKRFGLWAETPTSLAPLVTIGVPAYNESRFLADALNSVWLQSLPLWQCVTVDDCSSDQTLDIAKDYASLDARFSVIASEENGGLSASRNKALNAANTPYVTFLDGDDYLTLNSLWRRVERLVAESATEDCAGSFGGIRLTPELSFGEFPLSENKTPRKKVNFATMGYEAPFNAHAPVLRTLVMNETGGFDESMRHGAEDWECWTRILRAGYFFSPTHVLCGKYRQKRGSMVRSLAPQHLSAASDIYTTLLKPADTKKADLVFPEAFPVLDASASFAKRALRFATMAEIAGDKTGAESILDRVPLNVDQMERIGISIPDLVKSGATRFYSDTFDKIGDLSRKAFLTDQTHEISLRFTNYLENRSSVGRLEGSDTDMELSGPSGSEFSTNGGRSAPPYIRLEEGNHKLANIERLRAMRNKHAGERCFIIGNGPSLNKLDLTKIGNEAAIGVNGIFYKCDEIDWWPKYYTVEDSSVMNENLDRIIGFPAEQKFFPVNYHKLHPHDDNVNFFVMNRGFYEAKSPNFGVPRFSTDFAERAFCGQTVTYINMQLAFHLGFKDVYLIGMDFSYVIPKEFEKKGDMIVSTDDDPNHFHPDYFGKGKSWKDPKLEMVLLNYRMAKLAYEAAGRKIYNATAGGNLELFERVEYDGLFK